MKKRILLVDPLCDGHIAFNFNYIKALKLVGDVTFLCKESYASSFLDIVDVKTIKDSFFNYNCKIGYRISRIRVMLECAKIINNSEFNLVIFSSYETISTSIVASFFKKNCFLINHNNLDELHNSIKHFFMKKINERFMHVVFYDYMKSALKNVKNEIFVVPHPLDINISNISNLENCDFFAPSGQQNVSLLNDLIKIATSNNLKILLKKQKSGDLIENDYSAVKEYFDKFYERILISKVIVAAIDFKYRLSGVILESLFLSKIVLVRKCLFTISLKKIYSNNIYFIEDFIHSNDLKELLDKSFLSDNFKSDHSITNVRNCWENILAGRVS